MKAICLAIWLAVASAGHAWAWGQEGHSIVAEIAQRRLTPEAAAMMEQVLGRGHSLASIASWADDVRDLRTGKWHFVDIPIASMEYDPATQCEPGEDNSPGCIITELEQLKNDLRCAPDAEGKKALSATSTSRCTRSAKKRAATESRSWCTCADRPAPAGVGRSRF